MDSAIHTLNIRYDAMGIIYLLDSDLSSGYPSLNKQFKEINSWRKCRSHFCLQLPITHELGIAEFPTCVT